MDVIISLAPIALLIYLMTKRRPLPSHVALPLVALCVYAIKILYFAADPNLTNATVINGLLTAWTPILIIWGAIFLFKTMEVTGDMAVVRRWLTQISDNPVAQLMIIGWAFSFMIEGASGFGTPAALAAPLLMALGFPALRVAVLCLMMNSVPVSFGAVGTPTWFGLGQLGLSDEALLRIGADAALIQAVVALVIPIIALLYVVGWKQVKANLVFIYLSILSCVVPYVLVAQVNFEFPALVGGLIGFALSVALAYKNIGLSGAPAAGSTREHLGYKTVLKALFPIWATVLVLVITRIEPLGIKSFLTDGTPVVQWTLGSLGELNISPSLVIALKGIFGADSHWALETLYIPAFIPFFLVSAVSFSLLRVDRRVIASVVTETYGRMMRPIVALLGALVMVKLLMVGGEEAMVIVIGQAFADIAGTNWQHVASYLGALGSFFSGSATISNLTFAGIQNSIAASLGLDRELVLSLQSVGAAMGNMVTISNIVAVCSILGIANQEGTILKKTFPLMVLYGIVAALTAVVIQMI